MQDGKGSTSCQLDEGFTLRGLPHGVGLGLFDGMESISGLCQMKKGSGSRMRTKTTNLDVRNHATEKSRMQLKAEQTSEKKRSLSCGSSPIAAA